jgi:hypothetical protein
MLGVKVDTVAMQLRLDADRVRRLLVQIGDILSSVAILRAAAVAAGAPIRAFCLLRRQLDSLLAGWARVLKYFWADTNI